jgi:putative sigma-54 modulation protein
MELEFTGRHVNLTPRLEELTQRELQKLDKFLDSAPKRAHVILSAEKNRKRVEIVVYWRDSVFTGIAENSDFQQSIIVAAGKVGKQLLKLKEKFNTKKRHRPSIPEIALTQEPELPPAPPAPRIISQRRYKVKPMTQEEAALLLTDSDDLFIVFRDAETSKVGVLYKRTDNNFGLIEP